MHLLKRTEYVIGMTGTIAGNNDIEPFCVLHNLNVAEMGNINCRVFKDRFCDKELQYGPFGAFEKPVRLNDSGKTIMDVAYKSGCSFWEYDDNDEMPSFEAIYKSFIVPRTKTYDDALEGILQCNEFESTVTKTIAMQKAQQALNGFIYYNDNKMERNTFSIPEFENPKLEWVIKESKLANQIITYRFQADGYYIKEALKKANITYYETIKEFKQYGINTHCVLVLQCSKGKSVNLQEVCQNIIYYTGDFSFINFKQMIHRCWRRGQDKPCKVIFLVNEVENDKNKVEYKIWLSLQKKQSIHDTLMSIKEVIE